MEHDGMALGMFWAGLLLAAVPISLTIGVGVYVLKRHLQDRSTKEERGTRT
jgi:hypothetical protein